MPPRRTPLARRLRVQSTNAEDILWQELRGRRFAGWKFPRQMPILGFVVDFCCYEARLTIEIDGVHHADQPLADAERRRTIEAQGFVELRFTNDEVKERLAWVLTEIRRALDIAWARSPRDPFPRFDP